MSEGLKHRIHLALFERTASDSIEKPVAVATVRAYKTDTPTFEELMWANGVEFTSAEELSEAIAIKHGITEAHFAPFDLAAATVPEELLAPLNYDEYRTDTSLLPKVTPVKEGK